MSSRRAVFTENRPDLLTSLNVVKICVLALVLGMTLIGTPWSSPTEVRPVADEIASGEYVALAPSRIVDSRTGLNLTTALGASDTKTFNVRGVGGLPADGVASVVLSVTGVGASSSTYVSLWSSGKPRPGTSQLNLSSANPNASNMVVATPGDDGRVAIYNNAGRLDVVIDVEGYYSTASSGEVSRFVARDARLFDSRSSTSNAGGQWAPAESRAVSVAGLSGVPSSGVTSVVLTVTGVTPTSNSYLTAWPTGQSRPTAAQAQLASGVTTSTTVIAKLGADGRFNLYNNAGRVHVVVDVQGYFLAGGSADGRSRFVAVDPDRLYVTTPVSVPTSARATIDGAPRTVPISDYFGMRPADISAVVVSVAAKASANGSGHLSVTGAPSDPSAPAPTTSLIVQSDRWNTNTVTTQVSSTGQISIRFTGRGAVDLAVDVYGYYTDSYEAEVGEADPAASTTDAIGDDGSAEETVTSVPTADPNGAQWKTSAVDPVTGQRSTYVFDRGAVAERSGSTWWDGICDGGEDKFKIIKKYPRKKVSSRMKGATAKMYCGKEVSTSGESKFGIRHIRDKHRDDFTELVKMDPGSRSWGHFMHWAITYILGDPDAVYDQSPTRFCSEKMFTLVGLNGASIQWDVIVITGTTGVRIMTSFPRSKPNSYYCVGTKVD